MLTFLILLFPLSIASYCAVKKQKEDFIPICIGLISGILVCAFKIVFVYSHRLVPASFLENFLFYFINQTFLPVLVLYGVFVLVSKDDCNFKLQSFFPLMAAFYASYLPYTIIRNSTSVYLAFDIFTKPLLFLSLIINLSLLLTLIVNAKNNKNTKLFLLNILLFTIAIILPAVIETLHTLNQLPALYMALIAVYFLSTATNIFLNKAYLLK